MNSTQLSISLLTLVTGAALCSTSHAQTAGSWTLRGGATQIRPQVDSGNLSAPSETGTQVDVRPATSLSGGITYALSDQLSLDLPLALPFKHDIVGDGAIAGVGKIGDVRVLPVTLLAQWRFLDAQSALRPYLGAGLTYARFFKERSTATLTALTGGSPSNPTTLKVDSGFGASFQLGASYAFDSRWSLDAHVVKTLLKTTTTLSTGQTIDLKLDPLSLGLGIGYRF
jgi:outer membrane protein